MCADLEVGNKRMLEHPYEAAMPGYALVAVLV